MALSVFFGGIKRRLAELKGALPFNNYLVLKAYRCTANQAYVRPYW